MTFVILTAVEVVAMIPHQQPQRGPCCSQLTYNDHLEMMFIFTVSMVTLHIFVFVISLVSNSVASDYAASGSKLKADNKSRLFRRLTVLQCRIAQLDNIMRLPLVIRLLAWGSTLKMLQSPPVFFTFHLASIFTSTAVFLAADLFTVLRFTHVFFEETVDTILMWSDTKWFALSLVSLVGSAFTITTLASIDLIPLFVNQKITYDPMVVLWPIGATMYYVQPLVTLGSLFYTGMAVTLTILVHKKILYHLNDKFVNLAGITSQIRERRHRQNAKNFMRSIFHQIWRLTSVVPLCVVSLLPAYVVASDLGHVLYLVAHFICSVYQSCGVSVFFLTTSTIFNKKNHMGKTNVLLSKKRLIKKARRRFLRMKIYSAYLVHLFTKILRRSYREPIIHQRTDSVRQRTHEVLEVKGLEMNQVVECHIAISRSRGTLFLFLSSKNYFPEQNFLSNDHDDFRSNLV
jgi:hypothetical protein